MKISVRSILQAARARLEDVNSWRLALVRQEPYAEELIVTPEYQYMGGIDAAGEVVVWSLMVGDTAYVSASSSTAWFGPLAAQFNIDQVVHEQAISMPSPEFLAVPNAPTPLGVLDAAIFKQKPSTLQVKTSEGFTSLLVPDYDDEYSRWFEFEAVDNGHALRCVRNRDGHLTAELREDERAPLPLDLRHMTHVSIREVEARLATAGHHLEVRRGRRGSRDPRLNVLAPDDIMNEWRLTSYDLAPALGVDSHVEAEEIVRKALLRSYPEIAVRADFDSEGAMFSVGASNEEDITRLLEVVKAVVANQQAAD